MRGFIEADRVPFATMNADPIVTEFLQGPMSSTATDDFIERIATCWDERGWGLWAIEVVDGDPFIGYVGLWPADHVQPGMVEVGWRLAAPHWGNGYAPEAAREAMRFGFEVAGLHEIVSFTVPQNRNSWRVMEKIGLERDAAGRLRPFAGRPEGSARPRAPRDVPTAPVDLAGRTVGRAGPASPS